MCSSEFDILKRLGAERELGLEPHLLPHIVHTLCEELLLGGYATGSFKTMGMGLDTLSKEQNVYATDYTAGT